MKRRKWMKWNEIQKNAFYFHFFVPSFLIHYITYFIHCITYQMKRCILKESTIIFKCLISSVTHMCLLCSFCCSNVCWAHIEWHGGTWNMMLMETVRWLNVMIVEPCVRFISHVLRPPLPSPWHHHHHYYQHVFLPGTLWTASYNISD